MGFVCDLPPCLWGVWFRVGWGSGRRGQRLEEKEKRERRKKERELLSSLYFLFFIFVNSLFLKMFRRYLRQQEYVYLTFLYLKDKKNEKEKTM